MDRALGDGRNKENKNVKDKNRKTIALASVAQLERGSIHRRVVVGSVLVWVCRGGNWLKFLSCIGVFPSLSLSLPPSL